MRNFSKYIRGYKIETVLAPLFKLFEATLELIVPLIIASIIDKGIIENGGNTSYIVKMSLLLMLLGAVGLVFSATAQYFAAKASVGYATKLRSSLFAHLQTLSYTEIDTLGTSTMVTRMTSDANQVQTGLNLTLRLLLRSPFVVFGAMIMAFTINVRSALTFTAVIPALAVVVFGIMLVSMPLYKKVQSNTDRVLKKTKENLSGARVIRAFCREDREIGEFNEHADALNRSQKFVGKISALMNPVTYVLINLAIVWLMYIGALEVDGGIITQGEVVALYNYMSQILVELIKLAMLIITISKALASADRIDAVFDVTSSQSWGSETDGADTEYAVELTDVSLQYKNSGAPSLSGISFKAKKGETVGVIGGTGSGKTSLINLIPRFYDATDGTVLVDGKDVKTYDRDALSDKIGIVPQKAVLFSGTLRDNMLWGNKNATDEELTRALEISEAADFTREKGGLDFKIEEGGKNLSGGQKQRLTIARALVKNPEILILDDSASALDYATDARLRSSIKEYAADKTVFIVSQRASSVMNADKIIVLEDGEVADIGTHDELLEKSSVYQEIFYSQFRREGV